MASGDTLCIFCAYHNEPPAASAATLDTRNAHPVLDFDDTNHEYAVFGAVMPRCYGGNGTTVYPHVAFSTATTGSAVFYAAWERLGNGQQDMDSDGFATAASVIIGAPATAGHISSACTIAFADGSEMDSVAAGEGFRLKVYRDPDNGSDDAAGDAELRFIEIKET